MHEKKTNWLPFNSVISGKEIINSILKEKEKIQMPILSDEQKNFIENKVITSFYTKEKINLTYFQNGKLYNLSSYIKKIDSIYHKIYFENKTILFDQIIKIN